MSPLAAPASLSRLAIELATNAASLKWWAMVGIEPRSRRTPSLQPGESPSSHKSRPIFWWKTRGSNPTLRLAKPTCSRQHLFPKIGWHPGTRTQHLVVNSHRPTPGEIDANKICRPFNVRAWQTTLSCLEFPTGFAPVYYRFAGGSLSFSAKGTYLVASEGNAPPFQSYQLRVLLLN